MTTANEALRDALVRHQIGLLRVSRGVMRRVVELLDASEDEIRAKIQRVLARGAGATPTVRLRRLEALLAQVREIRGGAWTRARAAWVEEMVEIAKAEPAFLNDAVLASSPVVVETVSLDARRLSAIATAEPFEGRTLRQWADRIADDDVTRIAGEIRRGMIQGETAAQISRRVVGTVTQRGADGVTEITRRAATSITRTAVNHVASAVRAEALSEFGDLFDQEQYVATLDGVTTPICRSLDGNVYPVGEGPRTPQHHGCRSLRVPYFGVDAVGNRPAKAATRRAALRDYARANGLGRIDSRDRLPRGHKTAFDQFERGFIRARTGRVPATTTYQDWLSRQPATFQDDVLGRARGRLFRDGGLRLDRFVNREGDELTLAQLARREAEAFRKAGLDPAEFV